MLTIQPVGAGRASYHRHGPTGRWVGEGARRLGLAGDVTDAGLRHALSGRHPASGALLVEASGARRRPGWELVIAAPKSVSLVAALVGDHRGTLLGDAHMAAADAAVRYLERHATFTRRAGQPLPATGLVAARFAHRSSGAGDPHLHVHVLVANLAEADGRWSALHSRVLWHHARAADAVYHLTLRAEVARAGLDPRWQVTTGGAGDLAGVPRAAIDAVSSRRAQLLADAGDRPSAAAREVGRRRTRGLGAPAPWPVRVARAGFGPLDAATVVASGRGVTAPNPPAGPSAEAVEAQLLAFGSRFRPPDVLPALATQAPGGMSLDEAERWVAAICARSHPGGGGTLVSPGAQRADHAVAAAALARAACGAGVARLDPMPPWPLPAASVLPRPPGPAEPERRLERAAEPGVGPPDPLRRLVTAGHGVEVVGAGDTPAGRAPILAQAALIDAARASWQAAGHTVAVITDSATATARWEALTGLFPPERAGATATVVVVDRADRMSTPTLGALLAGAAADGAKVVLVEGGTSPARGQPRSAALTEIAAVSGRLIAAPLEVGPARHPAITQTSPTGVEWSVAADGSDALSQLLAAWAAAPERLMVAPGASEVELLNGAAREHLGRSGTLSGPSVDIEGLALRAGERVVALRRGAVPAGTIGVLRAAPGAGSGVPESPGAGSAAPESPGAGSAAPESPGAGSAALEVDWPGRADAVPLVAATPAGAIGYAYAVIPGYLRAHGPDLLVLGDPQRIESRAGPGRVTGAWLVGAATPRHDRGPETGRLARILADLPPSPPGRPERLEVARSLTDLGGERASLEARLLASIPPDPSDDRRRLDEDRAWVATRPASQRVAYAQRLDREGEHLETAVRRQAHWAAAHTADLRRWDDLGRAMDLRAGGLDRLVRADLPDRLAQAELTPTARTRPGLTPDEGHVASTRRRDAGIDLR